MNKIQNNLGLTGKWVGTNQVEFKGDQWKALDLGKAKTKERRAPPWQFSLEYLEQQQGEHPSRSLSEVQLP